MPGKESFNKHIRKSLPELLGSVLDIVGIFNSPERDAAMLESAGLTLERALYPLLVLIGKYGPIGVVDLGERVGRDYTTVSRQVARLEELGLVTRRAGSTDRRTREATVTREGKAATNAVDAARERLALKMFRNWSRPDYDQLLRLTRMLADGLDVTPAPGSKLAERMAAKTSGK
ncbi:MarR family winged helix-turn-helix transcriptional regulator [Granulicella tundricola]|uniref:Regulatory protein MarR n=1 Tax=Granulicella tundricola (strain ATCC BAA-1859 / DSM 23138 / MP5ACTX9) TaxID=1198114 RepID=E8WZQ0_GRATM|nr:MarR family transcriptional regulator [Granulicella tundricola]ADW70024.1 regulatory protein MarR [Granulicella tundricola MP5ACTX9]